MQITSSLQLPLPVKPQPTVAQRAIQFSWKEPDTEPGVKILGYRVYRSRRSNGYKAVQIGTTLYTRFTDYEPQEGENYYSVLPVAPQVELPLIDIPITQEHYTDALL